jgi:hypothetical protein
LTYAHRSRIGIWARIESAGLPWIVQLIDFYMFCI